MCPTMIGSDFRTYLKQTTQSICSATYEHIYWFSVLLINKIGGVYVLTFRHIDKERGIGLLEEKLFLVPQVTPGAKNPPANVVVTGLVTEVHRHHRDEIGEAAPAVIRLEVRRAL